MLLERVVTVYQKLSFSVFVPDTGRLAYFSEQ